VTPFSKIALIGFGEVGQILAADLARAEVQQVTAWDILFGDPASAPSQASMQFALRRTTSAVEAVAGADLIISAVTAAQDLAAAQAVAEELSLGQVYLDLNSCSPGQKQAAAEAITSRGGAYVEAAVMSPFPPKRIASPMLLGGPDAQAFLERALPLGFSGARVYSPTIGQAAATKLCRSVMIKGVEALLTESLLAARHYGVEREVLNSLSDLLPLPDWQATAQYMISRSLEHGTRRAEEMREAGKTVAEARVAPLMSQAIAERQDWAADYGGSIAPDLNTMLDVILKDMR
jgi:3-hydroxyisobutyrate dehydrogenase-like beta-hydroxyacid dehydrogenase